jgi:phenylacetate-coenzyme A ligase PaaK-like adenylate-forming protein
VISSAVTTTGRSGARSASDRDQVVRHLGEMLAREGWPRERLIAHQRARLRDLLAHAVEHSPYYAEALGPGAAGRPLSTLPVLSKRTLMDQWDRIVCDRRLTRAAVEAHAAGPARGDPYLNEFHVFTSSGSSGLRGLIVFSRADWEVAAANILRCVARAEVRPGTRTVAIGGADPLHMSRKAFAVAQAGDPQAPVLSALTPLAEIVSALNHYQPEALYGYPSVAALLAREQLAGRLTIAPRWLAFGSEPLTAAMRAAIRRAWSIEPCEYYASTELPVVASSAPSHPRALEIFDDLAVVEVVGPDNHPVPAGTPGAKVLITNLEQRTLPLIRYELSDRVTLAPEPNPAGRPFRVIGAIEGRSADTLVFPARRGSGTVAVLPFGLADPLAHLPGIRQYQLVHNPGELLLRLVLAPDAPADLEERAQAGLIHALEAAGARPPAVRVAAVPAIDRDPGAAAKLKLIVNSCASTPAG